MAEATTPAPTDFDGWVMIQQSEPGMLLQTDIERIDTDHQDAPLCEGPGINHSADYGLSNPEEYILMCQVHVQALVDNQPLDGSDYVIGKLAKD